MNEFKANSKINIFCKGFLWIWKSTHVRLVHSDVSASSLQTNTCNRDGKEFNISQCSYENFMKMTWKFTSCRFLWLLFIHWFGGCIPVEHDHCLACDFHYFMCTFLTICSIVNPYLISYTYFSVLKVYQYQPYHSTEYTVANCIVHILFTLYGRPPDLFLISFQTGALKQWYRNRFFPRQIKLCTWAGHIKLQENHYIIYTSCWSNIQLLSWSPRSPMSLYIYIYIYKHTYTHTHK